MLNKLNILKEKIDQISVSENKIREYLSKLGQRDIKKGSEA